MLSTLSLKREGATISLRFFVRLNAGIMVPSGNNFSRSGDEESKWEWLCKMLLMLGRMGL